QRLWLLNLSDFTPTVSSRDFRINTNYLAPAAAHETPIIVRNIGDVKNRIFAQFITTPLQIY
ncbi:hypothetical protein NAI44_09595, partial [Francisella tularensis subsp. holarctica]|nr:hypothetical protein [Francisella tularensis subsp. holarctica]